MMNRTNRKNSANLLGLNLGTRSLAVNASVINRGMTLRDGFVGYQGTRLQGSSIEESPKPEKTLMPAKTGSSPAMPEPFHGLGMRQVQVQPTIPATRPVSPSVVVVRSTDARIRRDIDPRDPSAPRHPGTTPAWRCADRYRARAEAALRSEATP